jgi:hypothetical protein
MSQRMEALAKANDYRLKRAQLKREVRAGETSVYEVLRKPTLPNWLENMMAAELIAAIRRVGEKTANKRLAVHGIPQRKTLGSMTYRQRRVLAEDIKYWEAAKESGRRARPQPKARQVPAQRMGAI